MSFLIRNIKNIQKMPDSSYVCEFQMYDEWIDEWIDCKYGVTLKDKAELNRYLLQVIESGAFDVSLFSEPLS